MTANVAYGTTPRILLPSNNVAITASQPRPQDTKNMCSSIFPVSMVLKFGFLITSNESRSFNGIPRFRANPLPDPVGITPNAVFVFIRQPDVAFIVPSPPATATISYLSETAFRAICIICSMVLEWLTETRSMFGPKISVIAA